MAKSMNLNMAAGLGGMLKDGHKHIEGIGQTILKNVEAVSQLAAITRTSLGPLGMNKLVINHLERIFVTSDTATIVKELDVIHPAAKLVVMAAKMQEQELGDGTNFVVSFAGELLKVSEDLIRIGLHPSEIITGYTKAYAKTVELLEGMTAYTLDDVRNEMALTNAIKPVLAAKQYGHEDVLAPFVAQACLAVMPKAPKKPSLNVDNVRVAKVMGGSVFDSQVIMGMILQRDSEGVRKRCDQPKVCVFGCGIEASSTEAKGTVLIKNAEELMSYNRSEEAMMEEAIKGVAETGVDCVISGGSISEMALHFLEKFNIMVIKVMSKFELRRLCRTLGATALMRLGAPTPEEMGSCDSIRVTEIGGQKMTIFRQTDEKSAVATVLLRASTENLLNDLERAVDDGVNAVKAMCSDARFLAGAGAHDAELAMRIREYANTCPGLDQYAVLKYADALEVVPRTLAENSGQNAGDVMSALLAAHASGQSHVGVNILGGVVDVADETSVSEGRAVLDLFRTRSSAFRLAIDAAITVLRVDQIIMSKPAGGPKAPRPGPMDA